MDKNIKVPSDSLVTTILLIIGIGGPILISMLIYTYIHPTYNKSVKLTEIKDHVMIHDDKLTIKSLPEPYHYKNNKLNNLDPHDFKITKDDFYSDANPKLVDRDGNTYEITTKELIEYGAIQLTGVGCLCQGGGCSDQKGFTNYVTKAFDYWNKQGVVVQLGIDSHLYIKDVPGERLIYPRKVRLYNKK